jgi:hypothetical protein
MLRMVTFTGPDDSTKYADLLDLSHQYPWVEWGILVSATQAGEQFGNGRFPSVKWVRGLQLFAVNNPGVMNLSMHICGKWTRQFMSGVVDLPYYICDGFERVQLNFHDEHMACDVKRVYRNMVRLTQEFIFQIDRTGGNKHLESFLAEDRHGLWYNVVPLFDVSGGAGILPASWPEPKYKKNGLLTPHGYAGGLGPHNLDEQIPRILEAAGNCDIWIDMETHVRTNDAFDLEKVSKCLEIAAKYMNGKMVLP